MVKSTPISQLQQKKTVDENKEDNHIDSLDFDPLGGDDSDEQFQNNQFMDTGASGSFQHPGSMPVPKNLDLVQSWVMQNNNLKYSLYVVGIFIIVSNIPIERIVYRYVSLNKLPIPDTIFKAIIAGVIFFILTKIFP